MAGSVEGLLAHGSFDPTQWDVKPYRAENADRAK